MCRASSAPSSAGRPHALGKNNLDGPTAPGGRERRIKSGVAGTATSRMGMLAAGVSLAAATVLQGPLSKTSITCDLAIPPSRPASPTTYGRCGSRRMPVAGYLGRREGQRRIGEVEAEGARKGPALMWRPPPCGASRGPRGAMAGRSR